VTLDDLYAEDIVKPGGDALAFATRRRPGSLKGVINSRADAALATFAQRQGLGVDQAQALMARLLRRLPIIGRGGP